MLLFLKISSKNPLFEYSVYLQSLKQLATILFSAIYLMATSGILVGQHLCMDRVKETALFQKVETKCGMHAHTHEAPLDCCEDNWSLEKVEDDQQVSDFKSAPDARYHLLYTTTFADLIVNLSGQEEEVEVNNTGPPDISPPDLNILFHNLKLPAALQS